MKLLSVLLKAHVPFGSYNKHFWMVGKPGTETLELTHKGEVVEFYGGPQVNEGRPMYVPISSVLTMTPLVPGVERATKIEPTIEEAKEIEAIDKPKGGRPKKTPMV